VIETWIPAPTVKVSVPKMSSTTESPTTLSRHKV
jgi:hypothetical protein